MDDFVALLFFFFTLCVIASQSYLDYLIFVCLVVLYALYVIIGVIWNDLD